MEILSLLFCIRSFKVFFAAGIEIKKIVPIWQPYSSCGGFIAPRKGKFQNIGGFNMHTPPNIETYKAKLDGKIKEWNAEADKLQAKAQQAGAGAQAKFREQMAAIRQKESEARAKLTEFGNATKSASDELKVGLDKAVNDLGAAVDKARAQFN